MFGIIFVFVIVLVAIAVIFGVRIQKQRVAEAWAGAARQLGMEVTAGGAFSNPKINGRVDDLDVKVDTFTRGSGNNSQTYTRYRVRYPSSGVDFELHRQTGFSAITKFFGAQDVVVGDQIFDDTFVVKSDEPQRVAADMTPTRRTTILQLATAFPGVRISNTKVQWETRGVATNPDQIVTIVRRLIGAAFVISGSGNESGALDDVIRARLEGNLADAVRKVHEAREANPSSLEVRRIEAQTSAEAGAPEAADLLEQMARELPDDQEIRGWRDRVASPARTTPQPIAAAGPSDLDAATMASDLFSESRLSFETSRIFDERYRGTGVRWSGSVRSTREYPRDPELGENPGTRVVVTVAKIENDLYGQATVDAVVGLPPGNANLLRGRNEITFEGTLSGIDAMMRNVFIRDATLV